MPVLEPAEGTLPSLLGHIAVHCDDRDPFGAELPGQVVDGALRVHEHEGRARRLRGEPGQGGQLVLRRHWDEPVVGLLHEAHLDGADLVTHRVPRVHLGDPADRAVEGRGEEHRLPILRQVAHDPIDLRLEPHVEHPVGLVEDEDLHAAELDEAALDEVVQPSRRGDQDVRGGHPLRLFPDPRAAVDGHDPELPRPSDVLELVAHLLCELTGRRQHEGGRASLHAGIDLVDDRDREPERLAGPRLGPRERVPPGGGVLDHHHLDRERRLDPAGLERAHDGLGNSQVAERDHRAVHILHREYRPRRRLEPCR